MTCDWPKSPVTGAKRRCRSLVFSQNTWMTICWKVFMEILPNDAKNILPSAALRSCALFGFGPLISDRQHIQYWLDFDFWLDCRGSALQTQKSVTEWVTEWWSYTIGRLSLEFPHWPLLFRNEMAETVFCLRFQRGVSAVPLIGAGYGGRLNALHSFPMEMPNPDQRHQINFTSGESKRCECVGVWHCTFNNTRQPLISSLLR